MQPEAPFRAMKVDVVLPSGDGCSIAVSPETSIRELKTSAEQHFHRRLKLTAKGRQLDLTATLGEAGWANWLPPPRRSLGMGLGAKL